MRQGQLMIDFLLLIIAISFVFVFLTSFVGEQAVNAQGVLYDSQVQERTLLSVLNKEVVEQDVHGNFVQGTIAELLWLDANNVRFGVEWNISDALNKTNPNRHYIFASTSGLIVFDKQDKVCLDDVSVASFEGKDYNITYGSWSKWINVSKEC